MSIATLVRRYGRDLTIKKKGSGSTDAIGGTVESFSSTSAVGFVQIGTGSDPVVAGREIRSRTATVYFPGEQDIEFKDRIEYDSATFEVSSVRQPDERQSRDGMQYTIVEMEEVI
tara:strand:+ start:943 stop:1287 length:345 start_codon:yes stop_codon:yes gene_type:complete